MDNTREKLIELIAEQDMKCNYMDCLKCEYFRTKRCKARMIADHLIANGVGLREQDCHWATEKAYKNGYNKGYEDGKRDALNRHKKKKPDGITEQTKAALARMGAKVHGEEKTELFYESSPCTCLPRRKGSSE